MSSNSILSERLDALLRSVQEANKLNSGDAPSAEDSAQKANTKLPTSDSLAPVTPRPSMAANATGSPNSRKHTREDSDLSSVKSQDTPSRLNPTASTYTPPQGQDPPLFAAPSADAIRLQKAYYEAQLQKAYRDGLLQGTFVGTEGGFKKGFEQGRKAGLEEGAKIGYQQARIVDREKFEGGGKAKDVQTDSGYMGKGSGF